MDKRRHPRLKNYDYSEYGSYFVTVCVQNRQPMLSTVVGRDALIPPMVQLTPYGRVLDKYIQKINSVYTDVCVDKYIIMPNHFHLLISITQPVDQQNGGMRESRPTVQTIIRSLKTMVTRETGKSIFQSSFHDHIIRDERDYLVRWQYIDDNPAKWAEDEYYSPCN